MAPASFSSGAQDVRYEVGVGRRSKVKRAVFFDRDGVLNDAVVRLGRPYPPASVDELHIDDGASSSLSALHERGFAIVVVTNQPDVARGTATRAQVEAINGRLLANLPIDALYVCYHDNADGCDCRKPKPGMLFAAAGITKSTSFGRIWLAIVVRYRRRARSKVPNRLD